MAELSITWSLLGAQGGRQGSTPIRLVSARFVTLSRANGATNNTYAQGIATEQAVSKPLQSRRRPHALHSLLQGGQRSLELVPYEPLQPPSLRVSCAWRAEVQRLGTPVVCERERQRAQRILRRSHN